ncbi:DUF4102 domain-containing protein [Salmonella enterica subsp. enterica]|nr:DUF4102 domain-containing protein [Salmonella enterica subsp. enterica]
MLVKLVRFAFYQHAEGTVMSLTDTKVKNARPSEKAVKLTDGFGLYLLVHPNGSKYWQLGYRFDGKQKVFSIGVYPAVSLADARQRRDEAKRLLAQGFQKSVLRFYSLNESPKVMNITYVVSSSKKNHYMQ